MRTPVRTAVAAAGLAALVSLTACGGTDVTRTRVEGSLGPTFANLYVQRAAVLGEGGVTAARTGAQPTCHRSTPGAGDTGPGADWVCMIAFVDDTGQPQDGKFELQVRSNSCWTAGAPTKLVGANTLTDTAGHVVDNPAFEFDGCFDPSA